MSLRSSGLRLLSLAGVRRIGFTSAASIPHHARERERDGEVDGLPGLRCVDDLPRNALPHGVRLPRVGQLQQVRAHVVQRAQLAPAADVDRLGERA